jgi:hypothetical protein
MSFEILPKPPVGNTKTERLKITLEGNHTLKQKISMLLEIKFWLNEKHGISFAGPSDVYVALIDQYGHPLSHFANHEAIGNLWVRSRSPYHCAADEYDNRYPSPSAPCHF